MLWLGVAASCASVGCARVGAGPPEPARDRFEIAGLDAVRVRKALEGLQEAVANEDRAAVAVHVAFPLRVAGRRVRTPEEMWLGYRSIWTPAVQRTVLAQRFDELFVNVHGVRIGNGVVWLSGVCDSEPQAGSCPNPRVRVTAVNPDAAK